MSKIDKTQITEAGNTSGYAYGAGPVTVSTATDLLTITMPTTCPPGDYLVTGDFACEPSGGGNCTVAPTISGTTGTLQTNKSAGIHGADADFNSTKYAHRSFQYLITGHNGGALVVKMHFSPESAVNFIFGNSGDGRWGYGMTVTKVG